MALQRKKINIHILRCFPDYAAVRRKDNKKWYAVLLTVSKRKLGIDSDETAEIIDLRINPENLAVHSTIKTGTLSLFLLVIK